MSSSITSLASPDDGIVFGLLALEVQAYLRFARELEPVRALVRVRDVQDLPGIFGRDHTPSRS